MVTVLGSTFRGAGQDGDFAWMIAQPAYADAFFVFNDNEEQYKAHRHDPHDPSGCQPGAGNAAIRPWQCARPPRAGGVPTGALSQSPPGYQSLDCGTQEIIDDALAQIKATLRKHGYSRVFYSAGPSGGLGTGTFDPAPEVTDYIHKGILALSTTTA